MPSSPVRERFRRRMRMIGLPVILLAAAACNPEPVVELATVVHTVVQTVEVTRRIEVPVTITPSLTPNISPTFTETSTATFTPTETSTPSETFTPTRTPTLTPSPTYSPPKVRVLMHSSCRYGPGVGYLYEYDLFEGNVMEVVGWREILSQKKSGDWEPAVWAYIRATGSENPCWIYAPLFEVIRGDLFDAPMYTARLPFSELYYAPKGVSAWRVGNMVDIAWTSIWMTEDDYRGYLVEAWVCHQGRLYFTPVGYTGPNIATPVIQVPDEPGCSERSSGRLYAAEKHGYTPWIPITWPEPEPTQESTPAAEQP